MKTFVTLSVMLASECLAAYTADEWALVGVSPQM
jgi:hypothetical protein